MLLGIVAPKLASPGQWAHRFKVGLGLDLSSGTQVTLQAQTQNGKAPSKDEMNAAISVIQSRVNGTGNSGAQVQPQGTNLLIVTVPGKGSKQTIQLVSSTALLMFRQALLFQPYGTTSTTPAVTPSASASAGSSSSASPSASGSPKATPSASATSTAKTSAKIVPAATSSPSPSASGSARASSSASPSASASASPSASSSASSTTLGNASLVTDKSVMKLFNKLV